MQQQTLSHSRSELMADDLKAQEVRGMAKYATDEPSENWGPEFHMKFKRWEAELEAYQRQELAAAPPLRRHGAPGEEG